MQKIRKLKAMTQQAVAEKIGLARTAVIKIESGEQRITVDQLFLISRALQVNILDLMPQEIEEDTSPLISVAQGRTSDSKMAEINRLLEK